MSNTPKLTAQDGYLYLHGEILICFYGTDCDSIPFPFVAGNYWTRETWDTALVRALYDARETTEGVDMEAGTVELPDGTLFNF